MAVPTLDHPAQLLDRADDIKTTNHAEFVKILGRLDQDAANLPADQQWLLRYLDAWQQAFDGDYARAGVALKTIAEQAPDAALRLRATATLINIFGFGHRYEEAFVQLNRMGDLMPLASDKQARFDAMSEATQFLVIAGQYELAGEYAEQMFQNIPPGKTACRPSYFKLHALFHSGKSRVTRAQFQQAIDLCTQGGESLIANAMLSDMATFDIEEGRAAVATRLLEEHYPEVEGYRYPALMEYFNVLLARGYLKLGDVARARKFALATIASAIKDEYSEPLRQTYELLYRLEAQQGNARAALDYHEKYMAADKAHLSDIGAGALAYQTVKQQLLANRMQVDTLAKQNRILQLQRALDLKAVETSRLYIALLLTVLASITLLFLRLKRSQMRFMRLATQDSLTGISSRQHFVDATEQALRLAARTTRCACLILMDLDHFKQVNDTYGHVTGDLVLKRAVAACQQHLGPRDLFGRLGGEEFAILMPDCSAAQARERAERLRQAISATPLWGETRNVVISASFGVASTDRSGYELRQLMIDADNALYCAKRDGRDRVVYGDSDDAASASRDGVCEHVPPADVMDLPPFSKSTG
ncbi:GGDEF domain-containing protein [Dyella soli]|uniref:diguanylate cyclase n=1 Tax=Dyella soli TaxID=522319 RepID=A0A4V2NL44_9GAMM|nr:GGDEF domain-containing protein [Dyella soli]TCI07278.1 GGDEF domain-containing protein [Dyella soli]